MLKMLAKLYWAFMNALLVFSFKVNEKGGLVKKYKVTYFNGDKVSMLDLVSNMDTFNSVLLKDANDNGIVMTHGNPDGTMKTNIFELYSNVGLRGTWTLVACYNATRGDFKGSDFRLIREPNTISNDIIAFSVIGGELYISTEPSLVRATKMALKAAQFVKPAA